MKSREFFELLKLNNFDFKKTDSIYEDMTDIQREWLSYMLRLERKEMDRKRRSSRTSNRVRGGRRIVKSIHHP